MSFYWKTDPSVLYEDAETALEDIDMFLNEEDYTDKFIEVYQNDYSWAFVRTALMGTEIGKLIVRTVEDATKSEYASDNLCEDGED